MSLHPCMRSGPEPSCKSYGVCTINIEPACNQSLQSAVSCSQLPAASNVQRAVTSVVTIDIILPSAVKVVMASVAPSTFNTIQLASQQLNQRHDSCHSSISHIVQSRYVRSVVRHHQLQSAGVACQCYQSMVEENQSTPYRSSSSAPMVHHSTSSNNLVAASVSQPENQLNETFVCFSFRECVGTSMVVMYQQLDLAARLS